MASTASVIPRSVMRSAQRPVARLSLFRRSLSNTRALRVFPHNPPPMEPHKQRDPRKETDIGVGELEGTEFRIEPMRRTGEDDATMRARLVYQSRKRGTLEADLLLSTFADRYLPKMTREQMAQYDRFLDENDWDIYYWATQEPPSDSISSSSATVSSSSSSSPSIATSDTSSASYAGGAEAAISEATSSSSSSSSSSSPSNPSSKTRTATSEPISTGGSIPTGDAGEGKEEAATAAAPTTTTPEEPYHMRRETGEWAQTVGTFKPAYRPVPQRWRDSEILRLLRDHVRARAKETGGMAFMPALREP
ncbi:hypothetical protein M434DRAFT_402703 [Hypoxylon sp. CO27-5]|nr:hypothetical protein M434DRAFT_402703 [Hypoxylon sp. CO27-5]